jgi:hypothetical protein
MNYRCPKCQSPKIMPVASAQGLRPDIPKSLLILVPSLLLLLLMLATSLAYWVLDKDLGLVLQLATIGNLGVCVVSALIFWRNLPKFKHSMQTFMRSQKHWQCRQCHHHWQHD